MNLPRRRILQAAALTPIASLLPRYVVGAASTSGTRVGLGTIVDVDSSGGVSLSWIGPESVDPVATLEPWAGGAWQQAIAVAADHGHGPPDPTGRIHGPAVIVPGAESYRITTSASVNDLRYHHLVDLSPPSSSLSTLAVEPEYPTQTPAPDLVIIDRSNWATRGRRDTVDCYLRSSVLGLGCRSDVGLRHGIIHHTVNTNGYAPDDVPLMLRLIQSYHMDTRGWNDIGYNFVIDRFARVWQAREGDIYEPITAGHTTGLNAESVGVAVLGDFSSVDPGQAVIDSLGKLLGWKLGLHGVDPQGRTLVRSAGGDYAERDDMVDLRNISGHRDNQQTACPGNILYGRIDEVRAAAAELVPVFGHLIPHYALETIGVSGWAIDRFNPGSAVAVDIVVDGSLHTTMSADRVWGGLDTDYPAAGSSHGFVHSVPIDLDTSSIVVTARSDDDLTARLMSLKLFAGFIDVEPSRFFAPSVYWLRQKNLTTGTQPGLFEPMDEVTRAVMATFLWRYMDQPAAGSPAPFDDVAAGSFYADAVAWLHESGITTGTGPGEFSPDDWITRAQVATFIWRMCGRIPPSDTSPFVDVAAGTYFTDAVSWMWETGITTGVSDTLFDPHAPVRRGELATFLHRLALTPEAWTATAPPPVVTNPV